MRGSLLCAHTADSLTCCYERCPAVAVLDQPEQAGGQRFTHQLGLVGFEGSDQRCDQSTLHSRADQVLPLGDE